MKKSNGLSLLSIFLSLSWVSSSYALTPAETETVRAIALEAAGVAQNNIPVGTIILFAGTGALDGFVECDGSSLPKPNAAGANLNYQALYDVIGETYTPQNERSPTHFKLPDLRGRVAMGAGQGEGLMDRILGGKFGSETHTLTKEEMPAHKHTASDSGHNHGIHDGGHSHSYSHPGVHGDGGYAKGNQGGGMYGGAHTNHSNSNISLSSGNAQITIENTGGNAPHNNIQPSTVLRYLIRFKGTNHYPTHANTAVQTQNQPPAAPPAQAVH